MEETVKSLCDGSDFAFARFYLRREYNKLPSHSPLRSKCVRAMAAMTKAEKNEHKWFCTDDSFAQYLRMVRLGVYDAMQIINSDPPFVCYRQIDVPDYLEDTSLKELKELLGSYGYEGETFEEFASLNHFDTQTAYQLIAEILFENLFNPLVFKGELDESLAFVFGATGDAERFIDLCADNHKFDEYLKLFNQGKAWAKNQFK